MRTNNLHPTTIELTGQATEANKYSLGASFLIKVNNVQKSSTVELSFIDEKIKIRKPSEINMLEELGFVIDWESIKKEYSNKIKALIDIEKIEAMKKAIIKYQANWIHTAAKEIKALNLKGVEVILPEEEKAIEQIIRTPWQSFTLSIKYRGFEKRISKEAYSNIRYTYEDFSYKTKWGKSVTTLVKNMVKYIDSYIIAEERQSKEKAAANERRQNLKILIENTFGFVCTIHTDRHYTKRNFYITTSYSIKVGEKDIKIMQVKDDIWRLNGAMDLPTTKVFKILAIIAS